MRTLLLIMLGLVEVHTASAAEPITRRWIYLQTNLQVAENVDRAEQLLRRGVQAGYNAVVLADYKLNILDRVPEHYFTNAARFRGVAQELGIEIIPAIAPMGYSDGLLAHDPNLAEGIPVSEAPLLVTDGIAQIASNLTSPLPGGEFEEHRNHAVTGWDFQDAAGQASFVDTDVRHSGQSALRWDDPGSNATETAGNARVSRQVAVDPWRQYHLSVWIKTQNWESARDVRLFAMGEGGRVLSHNNLGVKPTQDWTQHQVVFNSLDNSKVRIYCGTWGGRGGTLWMDELRMEESAFVNLLRRDGCPLRVTGDDGTEYVEGRDYEPLHDAGMGNVPWAGNFDVWHQPPVLRIAPGSRIRDGQQLRASFYHTVTIYDGQVCCCLAHPKVFEIFEQQVRKVEELFHPQTYFLSHDEIRVANWCGSCRQEGRTAGQLLAENVRQCVAIVRRINPEADLGIWSDMFDPHHNARDDFYLVNGDLAGSWEGLPPKMIIVNWNSGHPEQSLRFFGERGHSQVLAGYYDNDPQQIKSWIAAGGETGRVTGAMYTTWQNDFSQLEAFAAAAWGQTREEQQN